MIRGWRNAEPLTISTPGDGFTIDPETGNEVPAPATEVATRGLLAQQNVYTEIEQNAAGATTVSRFTLIVPYDTHMDSRSTVTDSTGRVYQVVGDPTRRRAMRSRRVRFRSAYLTRVSDLQGS